MATITASPTGGFWSATTAWVGGVVPTTLDDVILSATSGNITVSDNRTCRTLNATSYVNTFRINNGITLSVSNNTITLGSGMTYDQTTTGILSNIVDGTIPLTINFNSIVIPNLTLGTSGGTTTRIVTSSGTTPTVRNLVINNTGGSNYNIRLGNVLNVNTSLTMTLGRIGTSSLGSAVNLTGNVAVSGSGTIGIITISSGGTLNMSSNLNIESITFSGTGALIHNNRTVNFVFTSFNGITINTSTVEWWNVNVTTSTCTFTSNLNVGNDFNETGSDFTSSAGVTINIKGNLTFGGNGAALTSNLSSIITFTMIGTTGSSVTMVNSYAVTGLRLIIGSASSGYTLGSAARLNFTTAGTNTLTLSGNTATASFFSTTGMTLTSLWTFDVNRTATGGSEIILPNLNVGGGSGIVTLVTDTKCSNFSTTGGVTLTSAKLLVSGNIAVNTFVGGTSTIEMTGGVARTMSIPDLRTNLIVNKTSGATVTSLVNMLITATMSLSLSSITNFGTTLVTLGAFAITINNPSGSAFYDLTGLGNNTYTINNPISVTRNLTLGGSGNVQFTGSGGITNANLLCSIPGTTITLNTGNTYSTTTSVNMVGTFASRITMQSVSSGTRAIWTLAPTATQSMVYVNGTRIDSSLGQTIWSFGATLTDTRNWNIGSQPQTVAYTFIA